MSTDLFAVRCSARTKLLAVKSDNDLITTQKGTHMPKLLERIAVLGLGYVGLPVAAAFSRVASRTVGFDISSRRIEELRSGYDRSGEMSAAELEGCELILTSDQNDLRGASFYVVTVPTPVDDARRPDLTLLERACDIIGDCISAGAVVVFESTVFPGATEEICGPRIARKSGLACGKDFFLGYSPERINPGDKDHSLSRIIKVVSGQNRETLDRVATAYEAIADAGVHRASTIQVAEAAKVIENIQRDLNIALMNELALIFDRLNIRTRDVLEAAGTKWNFLPFSPGLVGGHCIGVDPYYLTARAEGVGYHPEVILAGRRINDGMATFLAQKVVKLLAASGETGKRRTVGVLGLTFKENVPDLRNSKVVDLVVELRDYGMDVLVHDPMASREDAMDHYEIALQDLDRLTELDAIVLAVPHRSYLTNRNLIAPRLKNGGIVIDIRSVLNQNDLPPDARYWCL